MKVEKVSRYRKIAKEFKEFAIKGNAIELAVGVVIGAAFKDIVDILVGGIIMPPLSLLTGKFDFTTLYWNITGDSERTIAEAQEMGDVIIKYGELVNSIINFLVIAIVIFIVIKQLNRLNRKEEVKEKKKIVRKCPFCFQEVHEKATKCPHCTSSLT
jgi:large conductance mechanosensitive channel